MESKFKILLSSEKEKKNERYKETQNNSMSIREKKNWERMIVENEQLSIPKSSTV